MALTPDAILGKAGAGSTVGAGKGKPKKTLSDLPEGWTSVKIGNKIIVFDDFGDKVAEVDAQDVSGQLIPTEIPGVFINPNTGAIYESPTSGGGGTGRDVAAQELDRAQAAHLAEQDRLAREQLAESKRQTLLSTAGQLVEAQMSERQRASEQSVQLAGNDPFRFLAQIHQQQVGDVRTPYDIFKERIGAQATAPVPQLSPNATVEDLESAIGKLQGQQQQPPVQGAGIGFAGGGQAPLPGPLQARLIGEQGSYIAPGTEVLLTGNGQATVVPLGQGMQQGGQTPLSQANLTVLPQLFERLRRDVTGDRPGSYSRYGFLEPGQAGREPRFGAGYGALAQPLSLKQGYQDLVGGGVIGQQDADRIVNLIGLLPNPRNASAWLRNLSPTEKEAVISAYKLAGIPETEFDAMLQSATLAGPQRQAIRFAA